MRVVALFRVSTEKQSTEGSSLDAQQRIYREMAPVRGWVTVQEFMGYESASQAASDRRVLQQVLTCIRTNEVDAIYVHEQSRLTRGDQLEVALLFRELQERKIKILVGGVLRDPSSIDDGFMLSIQSLVDHTETRRIKERMQRGKKQRAMQGKKTSGPSPYGYRNPLPHESGRGTLQIVDEEAVVVRKIFQLAAAGKGDRCISRDLNDAGIPAPRGGTWGKSTVRRVLECPAYIGTSVSHVWVSGKQNKRSFKLNLDNEGAIKVADAHAPIIDRETWDAVRSRPRVPRTNTPRLLTGLLHVDGKKYDGTVSKGKKYYAAPKGTKGMAWLEEQATDDAIWDHFVSLASSEQFVKRLLVEAHNPTEQEKLQQEIGYIDSELARLRKRLDGYFRMRADDEMTKEQYAAKKRDAEGDIAKLSRELADLQAKTVTFDGTAARRVVKAVQAVLAGRTRLDPVQRRRALQAVTRRIDVVAKRSDAPLQRDEMGRVERSTQPRWIIKKVTFQFGRAGVKPASTETCGDRQLATTYSCLARRVQAKP